MDKISTSELMGKVAMSSGVPPKMVKDVFKALAEQINGHVANGVAVQIYGLGKFSPLDRKARVMVCPMNGKKTEVSAKRVLSFKASKKA